VEEDPYDRSYTLYNIGLIYGNTGKYTQALEFYHQALALNSNLPQALNNIAVIYHSQALRAQTFEGNEYIDLSKELFDKAAEYWIQALKLAPDNYPGARNWLKVTGRLADNNL
jgi:tetratricopeptide (TPR) repeat protein